MKDLAKVSLKTIPLLLLASFSPSPKPWMLFPKGSEFYNYSIYLIEEKDVHHLWWCQNADPYQVVDHIYYRQFHFSKNRWTPPQPVLMPSDEGWDSLHTCDPAVVQGKFKYDGREYKFALFYLGTDSPNCKHNQIGVAFAQHPQGPWVKYKANPIIKGSERTWGVGQPSVISLDKKGKLLLFYTKQEEDFSTHTYMQELDFSDMSKPKFGEEKRVPTNGLREREEKTPVILNDADFAYNPKRDIFYLVRPQHPYPLSPTGERCIVSAYIQIGAIEGRKLRSGEGGWKIIGEIGPEDTGFPLNHSPSLSRNWYGWWENPQKLRINFSTARTGKDSLWSYTIYSVIIDLQQ
ncbi:hypothetical protein H5T87_10975 [bacterium]|nr:hypothetical protein [bacterium]